MSMFEYLCDNYEIGAGSAKLLYVQTTTPSVVTRNIFQTLWRVGAVTTSGGDLRGEVTTPEGKFVVSMNVTMSIRGALVLNAAWAREKLEAFDDNDESPKRFISLIDKATIFYDEGARKERPVIFEGPWWLASSEKLLNDIIKDVEFAEREERK